MKSIIVLILAAMPLAILAQTTAAEPFKGEFSNSEYDVYLKLDLHGQGIDVPGREMFGPLPGYLGKARYTFYWLITSAEVANGNKRATIQLINDYGSDDLEATLTVKSDSIITLEQGKGSTIKVPNNGKWQKLPKKMTLVRQRK